MKHALTILKLLGAALALLVALVGYTHLRVWQSNPAPRLADVRWQAPEVPLAGVAQLRLKLDLPWHRTLPDEVRPKLPSGFVLAENGWHTKLGSRSWNGFRRVNIQLDLIPTSSNPTAGQAIDLPLVPTRRISATRITAGLPPLTVIAPDTIPDDPIHSLELLKSDQPILTETAPALIQERRTWWVGILMGLALLCALAILIGRRRQRLATPSWTLALEQLTHLEADLDTPADQFFTRLTNTIKHYTTERFALPAHAASTSELVTMIADQNEVSPTQRQSLHAACRHADAAKFAARDIDKAPRQDAISAARSYIETTIPVEVSDA